MTTLSIILAISAKSTGTYHRKALWMFAIGLSFWFIAEQIWAVYDHVLNLDPFPSAADYFFVAAHPFFVAFLLLYLRPLKKSVDKKIVLFASALAFGFVIPSLFFTYQMNFQTDIIELATALFYPVADAFLLGFAIIGMLFLFRGERNYFWTLVFAGFIAIIIADTFFLFATLDDSYFDGHPVDALWLAGYTLFAFATYDYIKRLQKYNKGYIRPLPQSNLVEPIGFDTINKIGVPMATGITAVVSFMYMISLHYTSTFSTQESSILLTYALFGIISAFSAIIIMTNRYLTKAVRIKTQDLQKKQDQIDEQLKRIQKLDTAKDEFMSMITHELKTPLVPIKAYSDMLLAQGKDTLNERQKKQIETIKSSANSLLRLISDLLDVQKIELGRLRLDKEMHSLNEIIDHVVATLKQEASSKNIQLTIEHQKDISCICDRMRIEQVLTNLITNAIIYSKNDGGKIHITSSVKDSFAKISVKDNGVGIPKEYLDNVFVKFYQIDTSLTREHSGTGLGLSVCKGIVENHGGKIWVESEGEGKGCEFHFTLPLEQNLRVRKI